VVAAVQPVTAAAGARQDALTRLLAGAPAEARVIAVDAAAGLARILLDDLAVTLALPKDAPLAAGDRIALRQKLATDGVRGFEVGVLLSGETADGFAGAGRAGVARLIDAPLPPASAAPAARARVEASPPDAAAEAREMLAPVARAAFAKQTPMADLLARLAASLDGPKLYWPPEARATIAALVGRAFDPARTTPPADLRDAVEGSGVFLEADLARGGEGARARGDLKADLLALRAQLSDLAEGRAGAGEPPRADAPRAPLRGETGPLQLAAGAAFDPAISAEAAAPAALRAVEGALDRLRLLQFASLPEPGAPEAARSWQVEVPLLFGGRMATLPLAIERDGGGGAPAGDPQETVWRMRFAVETDELGHVAVAVAFRDGRVSVRFWAERPETADLIRAGRGDLSERLGADRLAIDAIRCQPGRRADPPPPGRAGQFVDRRS
jgi:hypothetical protein